VPCKVGCIADVWYALAASAFRVKESHPGKSVAFKIRHLAKYSTTQK
jgi:hypothetical protein